MTMPETVRKVRVFRLLRLLVARLQDDKRLSAGFAPVSIYCVSQITPESLENRTRPRASSDSGEGRTLHLRDKGNITFIPSVREPHQMKVVEGDRGTALTVVILSILALMVAFALVQAYGAGATTPAKTIIVGDIPNAVAVDTKTGYIFVTDSGDNNVTAINASNQPVANITVGDNPSGIAVNSATDTIYVADTNDGNVTVINGATLKATQNISLGDVNAAPIGIAVDPTNGRIYVANSANNSVSVISNATNAVIRTISVGDNPTALALNAKSDALYVVDTNDNNVSVVNTISYRLLDNISVQTDPTDIAVNTQTGNIYVVNSDNNTVSVIDNATNAVVKTVTASTSSAAIAYAVVVDQADGSYYVTNSGQNTVWEFNSGNSLVTTITVGNTPFAEAINPQTGVIYVANFADDTVSMIQGASTSTSTGTGPTTTSSGNTGQTTTTTSSTGTSKGGVPEFPFQLGIVLLVTVAVVAAYVGARRTSVSRQRLGAS